MHSFHEMSLARTVVLVEGTSDQLALAALAKRRDRDLDAEGISVVAMGGAQAIGAFLNTLGPRGSASSWRGCATSRRRATSGVPSSRPASGRTSRAPAWSRSASTCATQTSRTS